MSVLKYLNPKGRAQKNRGINEDDDSMGVITAYVGSKRRYGYGEPMEESTEETFAIDVMY